MQHGGRASRIGSLSHGTQRSTIEHTKGELRVLLSDLLWMQRTEAFSLRLYCCVVGR